MISASISLRVKSSLFLPECQCSSVFSLIAWPAVLLKRSRKLSPAYVDDEQTLFKHHFL